MNAEQRERMRKIGRAAFVREEMARLGYWPPDTLTAQREASAETQLRQLYDRSARKSRKCFTLFQRLMPTVCQ